MQIKLIPYYPHPTILFTIALPDPPEHLGMPPAWSAQLHRLGVEELELPTTLLALDKTAWIIACLTSVTFDISGSSQEDGQRPCVETGTDDDSAGGPGRVTCVFIDGRIVEWDLDVTQVEDQEAFACVQMLQSVCRDVHDSAVQAEQERMRHHASTPRQKSLACGTGAEDKNAQSSGKGEQGKAVKHKKQRSLLMSLVASLVSPRSSSSSQSQAAPTPPPPPPKPTVVHPVQVHSSPSTNMSSGLRKRARSTLVDAFRRYVLSKLTLTVFPACRSVVLQPTYNSHVGYFTSWVAQSMLERVEAAMENMILEAGGVPEAYMSLTMPSQYHPFMRTDPAELSWQEGGHLDGDGAFDLPRSGEQTLALVDEGLLSFPDDSDDTQTEETDGSSVHTPTDGVPISLSPFIPGCVSFLSSPSCEHSPTNGHMTSSLALPRSPSPPTPPPLPVPLRPDLSDGPSSISSSITIAIPQLTFTPAALTAYNSLSSQRVRLRNLLGRLSHQADVLTSEELSLQNVLEVKARRRAWSNREYMRKDSADIRFLGFAVPTRRSPLGTSYPICAEDIVPASLPPGASYQAPVHAVEGIKGPEKHKRSMSERGLVVTTAEHNIMRLFPVCEEEEDEDEGEYGYRCSSSSSRQDLSLGGQMETVLYSLDANTPSVRLVEDSILLNAEAGLLTPAPLQRHSVPIRPRTRSMIHGSPSFLPTPPLSPTSVSTSMSAPSSPSSALHSFSDSDSEKLEFEVLEPQTKVELFDVYSGDEDNDDGDDAISSGELGFRTEFTLSMDLPPPYRMGIDMHAVTRRYDNWAVGGRTSGSPPR